jgi:dTDP-4-amino-4,6-dideoxygalactose transaminase
MTQNSKIPFVDLVTLHRELEPELLDVCKRVIETAGFIGGPEVEGFEKEFAQYCDAKYCVGVNSGTDALRFALMAAGVHSGDIVLTVPHTFIATTEAISQAGGRPDFVDIDERTFTMDPNKLREYLEKSCVLDQITGRYVHKILGRPVTAVVPVHLYGQMADMDPILELAARYKLVVIEDACQAHGAEYFSKKQNRWMKAGSVGRAAAFSFYPGKNLGACGEGGAVTTSDEELARKCTMLRDHGSAKKYYHDIEGYNGRLDSIQAGMLRVKLRHLPRWNDQRRECAVRYNEHLAQLPGSVRLPYEPDFTKSVYHLYVVCTANRNGLQDHLNAAGIGTGIHYPIPLHLQNAYSVLNYKLGDFPTSEQAAAQVLSLPMYAGLRADQQSRIAEAVMEFATVHAVQ